jgi:hypothetical protein
MRTVDTQKRTASIASPMRNACIDFRRMTVSVAAVTGSGRIEAVLSPEGQHNPSNGPVGPRGMMKPTQGKFPPNVVGMKDTGVKRCGTGCCIRPIT